ncbi:MAG: helix-turn-helix domain-containing protein [Formivibrio sp.]|nr:helix-turn-helix domain-containing protein [Formivibrio sp.]
MRTPSSPPIPSKLAFSISEACEAVSISRSKLYELIGQGRIATRKIGSRTLIPADSLRALIAGEV